MVLVVESFRVVLVYVEVRFLSQEAIGRHFKQLSCVFTILFDIFGEYAEVMRALYHKVGNFVSYLLNYCETIFFNTY